METNIVINISSPVVSGKVLEIWAKMLSANQIAELFLACRQTSNCFKS